MSILCSYNRHILLTGCFLSKFCFKESGNVNTCTATTGPSYHPLRNNSSVSPSVLLLVYPLCSYALPSTPKSRQSLPNTPQRPSSVQVQVRFHIMVLSHSPTPCNLADPISCYSPLTCNSHMRLLKHPGALHTLRHLTVRSFMSKRSLTECLLLNEPFPGHPTSSWTYAPCLQVLYFPLSLLLKWFIYCLSPSTRV